MLTDAPGARKRRHMQNPAGFPAGFANN
jgi:hypothetical protein